MSLSIRTVIAKLSDNRVTLPIKASIMRSIAARREVRPLVNWYYGLLSSEGRARFHLRYAKIFREREGTGVDSEWHVRFCGHQIRMPLRSGSMWLDWDSAISIVGHDIDVKEVYASLIASEEPPDIFIDIGANYGTHSILFLAAGIPIMAFEPNPTCYSYFSTVSEMNGLSGHWEQVAIGDTTGEIDLIFPEKETWLGSVASDVTSTLKHSRAVQIRRVPIRKIDDCLRGLLSRNVLMKIDVEGYEHEVLRGAAQFIAEHKPKVVFESNDVPKRRSLLELMDDFDYDILLPSSFPLHRSQALSIEAFAACRATNFIAIPRGGSLLKGAQS